MVTLLISKENKGIKVNTELAQSFEVLKKNLYFWKLLKNIVRGVLYNIPKSPVVGGRQAASWILGVFLGFCQYLKN